MRRPKQSGDQSDGRHDRSSSGLELSPTYTHQHGARHDGHRHQGNRITSMLRLGDGLCFFLDLENVMKIAETEDQCCVSLSFNC